MSAADADILFLERDFIRSEDQVAESHPILPGASFMAHFLWLANIQPGPFSVAEAFVFWVQRLASLSPNQQQTRSLPDKLRL